MRQTVAVVLILTHLLYIIGCAVTTTAEKSPDQVDSQEKITEAVLVKGEVVRFPDGAHYRIRPSSVAGRTVAGDSAAVPLSQVLQARYEKPPRLDPDSLGTAPIKELVLKGQNRLITFVNEASYVPTQRVISGTTEGGFREAVPVSVVREFRSSIPSHVSPENAAFDPTLPIVELVTKGLRTLVEFDSSGGRVVEDQRLALSGVDESGAMRFVDPEDILYVRVERLSVGGSIFATLGVIALIGLAAILIIAATKQSCPFVYSDDGSRFVFDAEPLGGAISKGLAKTDFSRLDYLRQRDSSYTLLVRNEVPETQFLDELTLVAVDHAPGAKIIPDVAGNFHLVQHPVPPTRAFDEEGRDISRFVASGDGIFWQTKLPRTVYPQGDPLRHTLTFDFPRPEQAQSARLLVRAGTSLWGSNMIREMLSLRGSAVDAWYEGVDHHGPEYLELAEFVTREGLYVLAVGAVSDGSVVPLQLIPGGGPLVHEDRVIPIDLRKISGDTLRLQLRPPYGFWAVDYIAVDFGPDSVLQSNEISITSAENDAGAMDPAALINADGRYYEMPEVGNWFRVRYEAPPLAQGTERSLFLKTTGYYSLHLDKTKPPQTELIHTLLTSPGEIVKYALHHYDEWAAAMRASETAHGGVQ